MRNISFPSVTNYKGSKMRVLLVDDSRTILHVMTKMMNELGYTDIDTAENPIIAEEKIDNTLPDLIISDWNMPKGTGFDLLKFIRGNRETAKIPFIMLTSDHDKSKIVKAKAYNPQSYILKPATKQQLADRLFAIAKTHGIQPPTGVSRPVSKTPPETSKGADVSQNPQKPGQKDLKVDKELLTKTIKKLLLVFNEKADPAVYLTWIAEKYFSIAPENLTGEDIQKLSGVLAGTIDDTLITIYEENISKFHSHFSH